MQLIVAICSLQLFVCNLNIDLHTVLIKGKMYLIIYISMDISFFFGPTSTQYDNYKDKTDKLSHPLDFVAQNCALALDQKSLLDFKLGYEYFLKLGIFLYNYWLIQDDIENNFNYEKKELEKLFMEVYKKTQAGPELNIKNKVLIDNIQGFVLTYVSSLNDGGLIKSVSVASFIMYYSEVVVLTLKTMLENKGIKLKEWGSLKPN